MVTVQTMSTSTSNFSHYWTARKAQVHLKPDLRTQHLSPTTDHSNSGIKRSYKKMQSWPRTSHTQGLHWPNRMLKRKNLKREEYKIGISLVCTIFVLQLNKILRGRRLRRNNRQRLCACRVELTLNHSRSLTIQAVRNCTLSNSLHQPCPWCHLRCLIGKSSSVEFLAENATRFRNRYHDEHLNYELKNMMLLLSKKSERKRNSYNIFLIFVRN